MSEISKLPSKTSPIAGNEEYAVNDSGTTKKVTTSSIRDFTDQTASEMTVDTSNFDGNLSVADNTTQKAFDTIDDLILGTTQDAIDVPTDTSGFTGNLSAADTDVQKALDTIDDLLITGETNTASNQGTGGVGVFDNKNGVDLEFRNIVSDSGKVAVTLDAPNKEIDLDVASASDTVEGTVELATQVEVDAGTDTTRVITPATLAGSILASDVATNNAKVTNATHTGDVTGDTVLTIANDAVDNTKAANMPANTIKGNDTAGIADPKDLTTTELRTLINVEDGATANSTDAFLLDRANHTGTQTLATISDSGALAALNTVGTTEIDDNSVTNAKMADVGANTLKGNNTAGLADPADISVAEDRIVGRVTGGNISDLTGTQATTLLDNFVGDSGAGGSKGLVPAPAAGDAADLRYLHADGTWKAPIPEFSVGNSADSLAQLVPTGDPTLVGTIGYKLTSPLLEVNEGQNANKTIQYKDILNANQATFLDETNDKFLFPSNLNTFGATYTPYFIRTVMTVDLASVTNATTKFYVRLRRELDDSIIASDSFIQSDFGAETGVIITSEIKTFVSGEADPFVVDGCYLDILNNSNSAGSVTLQDVSIRIFRD